MSDWRGPGFDHHCGHRVVSLSKTHLLLGYWLMHGNGWLNPDMTEKLLTGMLNINTNKQMLACLTRKHRIEIHRRWLEAENFGIRK